MNNQIMQALIKPSLYEVSKAKFWDDEYISKQMLKAHLNPELEAASRKIQFIDRSVLWIDRLVPHQKYPLLVDIGCGPGLYTERFAQIGYDVTGVDFSKCSITYAQQAAQKQQLNIDYLCQDYLQLNMDKQFDLCTMIYCDYGALSTANRQIIMRKVYEHLRVGGKFLLDVFSMAKYQNFEEKQVWERCIKDGFWQSKEHIVLAGCHKYDSNVTLEQFTVISQEEVVPYYLWTTYFTVDMLLEEAYNAGFSNHTVFANVAGEPYSQESTTISILLEK